MDGTIGRWAEDVTLVLDQLTDGPVVLVGSSMGGWASLLAAVARKDRIAGWLGIAPAPDFTKDLMWEAYSDEIRQTLKRDGVYYEPSDYSDEPYAISMKLIEDGYNQLLLEEPIALECPIRMLHGLRDVDVPPRKSHEICAQVTSEDVVMTFVKEADHRMSEPADINRIIKIVKELCHYPQ